MNQYEQNNNNQESQLTDLPVNDEQAEQAKGGSLKYNFSGIEGAASCQSKVGEAGTAMQQTEQGVTGMFA